MGSGHLAPTGVRVPAGDQASAFLCVAIEITATIEFRGTCRDRDWSGLKVLFVFRSDRSTTSFLAVATGLFGGEIGAIQMDPLDRRQVLIGGSHGLGHCIDHTKYRFVRTRGRRWEKSGGSVSQVGAARCLDG